ncbi:MAG: alpha/beta hydrolase [Clostridia bacterium]|nr:alpha/beta hydrolase [Clostridia bacterium]
MKAFVYIHGKGGSAEEAEHYKPLFKDREVVGFDYRSQTPWEAKDEFSKYFDALESKFDSVVLAANSIGAFFAMNAGIDRMTEKAYFISPIADMEKLICDMMKRAGVTERELKAKNVIYTDSGEEISWEYLTYVREHPIKWNVPTKILYGSNDSLTSLDTIKEFAETHKADLTVMNGGEHWFHTDEQMRFLDDWLTAENE